MVKGVWGRLRFFCVDHEKPLPMIEYTNPHGFAAYVCPHYLPKDEENPTGYDNSAGEKQCKSTVNINDAVKIGEIISKEYEESGVRDEINLRGMRFKVRKIEYTVIKHTDKHIDIGVTAEGKA